MNQQIAGNETWARTQVRERAAELADRIIDYWPGPEEGTRPDPMVESWCLMNRALSELPSGTWTTYSDVARLIGSHAVPVGQRLGNHPVPNGYRVLKAGGALSDGFRWSPEHERPESQREILEAEGIDFDAHGRANPNQHVNADELAELAGVEQPEHEMVPDDTAQDGAGRLAFLEQLADNTDANTVHGVAELLDSWRALGGTRMFGPVSCFLTGPAEYPDIWPATLYPAGPKLEVVFQYLKVRPPFDDIDVRDKFRLLLNETPGVDLPASKLGMRPGFDLQIVADPTARQRVVDALRWFMEVVKKERGGDASE